MEILNWQEEIFEVRPPSSATSVFRYNNGLWTPDDGEWDVAFYGYNTAPFAWYMSLPYYANYQWGFLTTHWGAKVKGHPRGNAWHYVTADDEAFAGRTFWDARSRHVNTRAGDSAMFRMASIAGCANGDGAAFEPHNSFIQEGRVRLQRTGELVQPPPDGKCVYCACTIADALLKI